MLNAKWRASEIGGALLIVDYWSNVRKAITDYCKGIKFYVFKFNSLD